MTERELRRQDQSLVPSTPIKRNPDTVAHSCNPRTGKWRFLRSLADQSGLMEELQVRDLISKNKVAST